MGDYMAQMAKAISESGHKQPSQEGEVKDKGIRAVSEPRPVVRLCDIGKRAAKAAQTRIETKAKLTGSTPTKPRHKPSVEKHVSYVSSRLTQDEVMLLGAFRDMAPSDKVEVLKDIIRRVR